MVSSSWRRRLYRGGRPNRLARLLNRIAAGQFGVGFLASETSVVLEVTGRRSGRAVTCPLIVTVHGGDRYLVSMLGRQANWVANVRAAGGAAVLRRRGREPVRLVEVEVAERPPILRRYLAEAPGARAHVPVDRHAPLTEFERIAPDYPVFRITARQPKNEPRSHVP